MNRQPTPKVIGAFIIGFAMVAGAYVISNFGKPPTTFTTQTANQAQQAAPIRSAIEVFDENGNGIEDWRDEFVASKAVVVDVDDKPYQAPDTLTGQAGITFFQDVVRAGSYGPGGGQEQIINKTISVLEQQSSVAIYDVPDIKIIQDFDKESVRAYANAVALAILENNESDLDTELLILQDILNRKDKSRIEELKTLAELYRLTRDAIIDIPVPLEFTKQHLDLINTLHAVHHDILGMSLTFDDPVYSLMRLKRYEEDIFGMIYALENMYTAFTPYASLFTASDPAVFFVEFSPSNRIRI